MQTLLIISFDRISEWIKKGAYVPRYFNPGDLFDEVHFILLNQESPDPKAVQEMVGRARFHFHVHPTGIPFFIRTLGWQPFLLRWWCKRFLHLAREIRPSLIRCHWGFLNGFVAREIKKHLGIPYVISLHINLDVNVRPQMDFLRKVRDFAFRRFEKEVLQDADLVMPVYTPILPYLKRLGIKNYEVAYNVINPEHLRTKTDYTLHSPIKVVCVGRQIPEKNPENIIRAIAEIANVELTLVGAGPIHEDLKRLSSELGISDRIHFISDIPNSELCKLMPDFDIVALHTEYWELSKSILEALLAGMPLLLNQRTLGPVEELIEDEICLFVPNTKDGYLMGLKQLISNDAFRKELGERAYGHSQKNWSPKATERHFVEIYQRVMKKN